MRAIFLLTILWLIGQKELVKIEFEVSVNNLWTFQ